ncbi:MAG: aldo/keto reductase [Gemmataceae bacterium]|nr:aldo/keto reductase [Gemmataceae bacterium]
METHFNIDGWRVPRLMYGTAWKEERTRPLTELAVRLGFRAIDTANQRKHYFEAGVGEALQACLADGVVRREDLFLQTKFTFRGGQDHRLPYDPQAPISRQVEQSCASSLEHLGVSLIDSYVLHGPSQWEGLGPADWEAWRAMEGLASRGVVRFLGVSNVSLGQLQELVAGARVSPRFVQNRCFAVQGWDREVRRFAQAHGMIYQGFSLLTANRPVLTHPLIHQLARKHGRTIPQIIFRFALEVGMMPLTGTTDERHMRDDLAIFDFTLDANEVRAIESLAG